MVLKELALGLLGFVLYKAWKIRRNFHSINVPTPKYTTFLGHFRLVDPLVASIDHQKEMKGIKTFKQRLIFFNALVSYDINFIREVLSVQNLPKSHTYAEIETWWGKGNILTSQHENTNWKEHRHILNPIFRTAAIRKLRDIFQKHSNKLVKVFESMEGKPIEIQDIIQKATLDIIADAGFGYDLGALDDKSSDFLTCLKEQINLLSSPLVLFPYGGHLVKWANRKTRKVVDDVINRVIETRIQRNSKIENQNEEQQQQQVRDILDMMLMADQSYDIETLKSDLFTFFVAGHETSASSLSFLIYELAKNLEVQENAFHEVDSVLQGNPPSSDMDLMTSLPYLMSCLNEGLRLYPISGGVSRTVSEDKVVQGIFIPKGTLVETNFFLCQRDADIWEDPNTFNPSRFGGKQPSSNEFFPFSSGPRICIGKNFFYEESLVILSSILQNFSFTLEDPESGQPQQITGLLKPNKVVIKLTKRSKKV